MSKSCSGKTIEYKLDDEPVRMCVICRKRFPKSVLKRYILQQDNVFIPDEYKTKQGRGWYCCLEPLCQTRFATYRPKNRKLGKVSVR